jgi:hypothetical protein
MPAISTIDRTRIGEFNIRDFGAKQDGSTDDWYAIQEAIIEASAWQSAGGDRVGKVVIPSSKSNTIVTKELLVPADGLHIEGSSMRGVGLYFNPTGNVNELQCLFRFEKRYGYLGPDTLGVLGDSGTVDAGSNGSSTLLVQAGQNFATTCRPDFIIQNITKSTSTRKVTARVLSVDSNTSITHTPLTDGLQTYTWSTGDSFKVYPLSMIRFWRMQNLSLFGTNNTTHFKCGIFIHDGGSFLLEHIDIRNFWGNNSHGLWIKGREQGVIRQVTVNGAVIPLRMSPHTHHEVVGVNGNDLLLFQQCLFSAANSKLGTIDLGAAAAYKRPVIRAAGVPNSISNQGTQGAMSIEEAGGTWDIGNLTSSVVGKWVKNKTLNKYGRVISSNAGYLSTTGMHGGKTGYTAAVTGNDLRFADYPNTVAYIEGNAGLMRCKFDTVCFIGGEVAVFQFSDATVEPNAQAQYSLSFENCSWEQPDYDNTDGYEVQACAEFLMVADASGGTIWKNVSWRDHRFQTVGNTSSNATNASNLYLHGVRYATIENCHFDFGSSAGGTYLNIDNIQGLVWINSFSYYFTGTPVVMRSTGVRKLLAIPGDENHPMPLLGVWAGYTEVARTANATLTARPYKRSRHSNAGATGRVDLTLPSAQLSANLWDEHEFNVRADHTIRLIPGHASDRIGPGAANKYLDISGRNTRVAIRMETPGHWHIIENAGATLTWEA